MKQNEGEKTKTGKKKINYYLNKKQLSKSLDLKLAKNNNKKTIKNLDV